MYLKGTVKWNLTPQSDTHIRRLLWIFQGAVLSKASSEEAVVTAWTVVLCCELVKAGGVVTSSSV